MMFELYPQHLHDRLVVASYFLNKDEPYYIKSGKVILDEGFLYDKEMIAKLYYELGRKNIDVIAIGSI